MQTMNKLLNHQTPVKITDISIVWLEQLLEKTFNRSCVVIKSFRKEPLNSVNGFLSNHYRIRIKYFELELTLPVSLVVKVSHDSAKIRDTCTRLQAFEDEIRFYNQIAPLTSIKVPRCYFGAYDAATQEGLLIFEDLSSVAGGDQIEGMNYSDIAYSLEIISKFHAQWWNQVDLAEYSWIRENKYVFAHDFRLHWRQFKDDMGYLLNENQIELGDQLVTSMQKVLMVARYRPQSLIHGDLRADNLRYFPGKKASITVLDWQLIETGIPAFDFVRLACGSRDSDKKDLEALALHWYDSLITNGVTDYAEYEYKFDIQLATLIALHIPVLCYVKNENNSKRTKTLIEIMTKRFFRAAELLNAKDVLARV